MLPVTIPVDVRQCAPSGLNVPLERAQAEELTSVFKAIADPTRLQILALINAQENGQACVCDLAEAISVSQPTISHHLKIMTQAGLLDREKKGTWAWYSINRDQWSKLLDVLN